MKAAWKWMKDNAHDNGHDNASNPDSLADSSDGSPGGGAGEDRTAALNWADIVCRVCNGGEADDQIILCDGCNGGFHLYCFTPPLKDVPEGRWFCEECAAKPLMMQMRMAAIEQQERQQPGAERVGDNNNSNNSNNDGGDDGDDGENEPRRLALKKTGGGFHKRSTSVAHKPKMHKTCRGCYARLSVTATMCAECGWTEKVIKGNKRQPKQLSGHGERDGSNGADGDEGDLDAGSGGGGGGGGGGDGGICSLKPWLMRPPTDWTDAHDRLLVEAINYVGGWDKWSDVYNDRRFEKLWHYESKTLRKRIRIHTHGRAAARDAARDAAPPTDRGRRPHPNPTPQHQRAAFAATKRVKYAARNEMAADRGPAVQTPAEAFSWSATYALEKTRLAESWLMRSNSFLSPALRLSATLLSTPPPVPMMSAAASSNAHSAAASQGPAVGALVGWLIALHNSVPLPAVPVYANTDARIGRSSECELCVPASARHTSRLHAIVRYSSAHKGWWLHTCGKHGVVAGPHSTATVPAQKGWLALDLVGHCFGIAEDNLQISVVPITETSLFQSVRSMVMPPVAVQ